MTAAGPVLDADFSLRVGRGRAVFDLQARLSLVEGVLVLFGPSGTGKSLTIAVLAGLLRPDRGRLVVGGRPVFDSEAGLYVPAHRRRIGYVPQHRSLFPFKTVAENVAFGLPRAERRGDSPRVLELLEAMGLSALAHARPDTLSGGEQQRVALARALAPRPHLLLLDEPFASLDRVARDALGRDLGTWLADRGTPAVFVTHDEAEARALGDRVVLFERGRTTSEGSPQAMLGARAELRAKLGTEAPLPDGRVRWTLDEAELLGPPDSLSTDEQGRVRLSLPRP